MRISPDEFLPQYLRRFGRHGSRQTAGLTALLGFISQDELLTDSRHIAYLLATIKHETANTFEPIVERGSRKYFDRYEPATRLGKQLGNTEIGDGFRFRGRGYVQITGRHNYARLSTFVGRDLIAQPDDACLPDVAYKIASSGMINGLFTGVRLDRYITARKCDYVAARRVVNGQDRAQLIAGYAGRFEQLLAGMA